MLVGRQLAIACQTLQRGTFPDRGVFINQIEHLRLKHEKATVDPGTVTRWFFFKAGDAAVVDVNGTEAYLIESDDGNVMAFTNSSDMLTAVLGLQ